MLPAAISSKITPFNSSPNKPVRGAVKAISSMRQAVPVRSSTSRVPTSPGPASSAGPPPVQLHSHAGQSAPQHWFVEGWSGSPGSAPSPMPV